MADGEGIRLLGADVMSALEKLDAQARLRVAPDLCWVVRGVPIDVRAMADAAADERNLTLGDWLTNAIIDRARFEAAQAVQARTVQDPLAGAPWDETPQAAAEADLTEPVLLAPEALSDANSDIDTDALEALALDGLLPETLSPDAQAIEALAVEVQTSEALASDVMGPELYGPPAPMLLTDQAEIEASAVTEVAAPDELAAILDSVRAIVAFAKLDGDTVYGPDIMQVPAQPEAPQALWEEIPAEADLDADYGTALWFVEPETLVAQTVEAEASKVITLEAVTPEVTTLEMASFDALVQGETVQLAAPEDAVLLSEPLTLTLIEPETAAETTTGEAESCGETWLPKAPSEPKKSLLRRMFGL